MNLWMASSRVIRFFVTVCNHCGISEVVMLTVDVMLEDSSEGLEINHAHINSAREPKTGTRRRHGIDSGICRPIGF